MYVLHYMFRQHITIMGCAVDECKMLTINN
jgi:hypothetical protein